MHMKRALGTLTAWETFKKATEVKLSALDEDVIHEDSDESRRSSAAEVTPETSSGSATENESAHS
jgi:hypothetical protein